MNLSKEQEKAINHREGPALVLAVPGAGKTTVLIHRTVNLILEGKVSPERILSITFSRASARDMKERFVNNFPDISSIPIQFSTIHAFCYNLIREYAYMTRQNFTLIEGEKNQLNKYNLLKKLYLDINRDHITEEKLEFLLNSIGYIKNMMLDLDEHLRDNRVEISNFKQIYLAYEAYKKENKLIDFDDMLSLSLEVLSSNPYILDKYRGKYDYIQLDEGQDTSKIQMEIIKKLAHPHNNLFIVADDDQSIYGFRGANPKALLNFKKTYDQGKLFFMEGNYRSSKNIVSVSNKFIRTNTMRYNKNLRAQRDFLEPIIIAKVESLTDQYDYIMEDLEKHPTSKSAILYRNNLSAIGLIEVLERNQIPFHMRDMKLRFFNHWLIQDMVNFILFSRDTSQMSLYENIYYKKKGFISRKQINYARMENYSLCVFERILGSPGINSFYRGNLRQLKLDFKKLAKMKPKEAINFIERDLEYDKYLRENSMKFGYTYDNLRSILYYLKLIARNTESLEDLLERLDYLKEKCLRPANDDSSLTLSTIHSAKGLEFDRVYMIDLIDGDFPSITSIEAMEKGSYDLMEEERRLFYVAMTRARHHLSILTINFIGDEYVRTSRFIGELEKIL